MAGPKTFDDTMDIKNVQLGDIESRDSLDVEAESSDQRLKAVRRKVDIRILLWYSFVYLIMRIHVSNVSNVAIINLEQGTGIRKQLGNLSAIHFRAGIDTPSQAPQTSELDESVSIQSTKAPLARDTC
ncbi:hypothetical protein LTR15_008130 [Elasticomyces elasticus]|nr:hypothetical protein LTR15_008130 [Elasticomyces elasticus]